MTRLAALLTLFVTASLVGCGVLIPDTDASGEWMTVGIIVAVVVVAAVGFAGYQASQDNRDE